MAIAQSDDTAINYHHPHEHELEDPFDWDAWAMETEYLLGKQFEYENKIEESFTNQEMFEAYSGLGRVNAKLGFYSESIESYDKARSFSYNKACRWKDLEQLFAQEESIIDPMNLDQSVERMFQMFNLDSLSPMTWVALGIFLDKHNDLEHAKHCFFGAKTLDPVCCDAYKGLYMVHKKLGNQTQSLRNFRKVKEFFNPI
jgi:tetratricopeptide (TPR) repeat protein